MISKAAFDEAIARMLRPLHAVWTSPDVSEVMLNGAENVYVERGGRLGKVEVAGFDEGQLEGLLRLVAQYVGRPLDAENPILEARLPDGSRLQAIIPPLVEGGAKVAIRRHRRERWTLARLREVGALGDEDLIALRRLVGSKRNILVSGGTGTGKTSVLTALAAEVGYEERILVLEDARELSLDNGHVVSLEARPAQHHEEREAITIRDLFRASLRMRPDRLIIGEIRGGEALDLLLAMTSGHGGCLSTIHASSPTHALERMETLAMMAGIELPSSVAARLVASAIGAVVQVERAPQGRRYISHICRVDGLCDGRYLVQELGAVGGAA